VHCRLSNAKKQQCLVFRAPETRSTCSYRQEERRLFLRRRAISPTYRSRLNDQTNNPPSPWGVNGRCASPLPKSGHVGGRQGLLPSLYKRETTVPSLPWTKFPWWWRLYDWVVFYPLSSEGRDHGRAICSTLWIAVTHPIILPVGVGMSCMCVSRARGCSV